MPNWILAKHWQDLPPLKGFIEAYPETTFGASRFDLGLRKNDASEMAFLEAKCVTLVQENTGLFPDAPTERGRKHLQELTQIAQAGKQASVVFFLQHPQGQRIRANEATDPQFAELMAEAQTGGVQLYAYRAIPGEENVELTQVPVLV